MPSGRGEGYDLSAHRAKKVQIVLVDKAERLIPGDGSAKRSGFRLRKGGARCGERRRSMCDCKNPFYIRICLQKACCMQRNVVFAVLSGKLQTKVAALKVQGLLLRKAPDNRELEAVFHKLCQCPGKGAGYPV